MCDRFLKLMMSEETDYLQENHPKAFLLLIQICKNARRTDGELDGLQIGDSIVGEIEIAKKAGISRKEYRNALNKLEELNFIEIVWNPKTKKAQKRAIKRAIKSNIVNVRDSRVCDLNLKEGAIKREIKGRTEGDNQECLKNIDEIHPSQTLPLKVEPIQLLTGTDGLTDDFFSIQKYESSPKPLIINESREIKKQHNINYRDEELIEVYPGDPEKGIPPVVMKRSMYDKCLKLSCINNSEETLKARVKEIQEDPNRMEEIKNWLKMVRPEEEGGWKSYNKKAQIQQRILQNKKFAKFVLKYLPEDNLDNPYPATDYHDKEKDQKGLLIASRNGYNRSFTPYDHQEFQEKVSSFLLGKNFKRESLEKIKEEYKNEVC